MNPTTNIKFTDHSFIIAIDWATEKHDILIDRNGQQEMLIIKNEPQKVIDLLDKLFEENNSTPFAVVYEQGRHFLHAILTQFQDKLELYPIHPQTVAAYRGTRHSSKSKSDTIDCKALLEYFRRHSDLVSLFKEKGDDTLDRLCRDRRTVVDEKKQHIQQLHAILFQYFPQVTKLTNDHIDSKMTLAFLRKYSTPQAFLKATEEDVKSFYSKHRARKNKLEKRLKVRNNLVPVVTCPRTLKILVLKLHSLLDRIEANLKIIATYDEHISQESETSKHRDIVSSFPGAATVTAPRIISFLEKHWEKIDSSTQMQTIAAIAPIQASTGKTQAAKRRYLCDRFDQLTFTEWADGSLKKKGWQQEFYKQKKQSGSSHQEALRSLAFKWIRILYSCLKKGKTYSEDIHVKNQIKHLKNAS